MFKAEYIVYRRSYINMFYL